ncbi:MAG: DMT family transporter [Pseudomonadota bacterium]
MSGASARIDLQAIMLGVLAAFFSGTHSVIVRYLADEVHGTTIAVLRLYCAAIMIFVLLRAKGQPLPANWFSPWLLLTVLGFSANYVVFHQGLEYTGASSAMVLENTAPVFVLILTVLILRERIRLIEVVAALIALIGVIFTVRSDIELGGESLLGDELELLAGLTWAVFLMGSARLVVGSENTFERLAVLFVVLGLSAVLLTPFLFLYPLTMSWEAFAWILILGIFPTTIAYYLWYETAARVSGFTTSLLFTLTVIFTFVNARIFLDEPFTIDMAIGTFLIIASVLLSKWPKRPEQRAPSSEGA